MRKRVIMPHNSPSTPPPLQGRRILVVEDEMTISMILEDLLRAEGADIVGPVARLARAIDFASSEQIDAALLDLNIDGKAVYPVAAILAGRGIPFAFVSGYGAARLDELYRDRPILGKPFHVADLGRIVRLMLSQTAQ